MRTGLFFGAMNSVVVPIVHEDGVFTFESEYQTPVLVHGDSKMSLQVSFQPMETPAWQIHVLRRAGRVELRKLQPKTSGMHGLDARLGARLEKALQSLVPKAANHLGVYSIAIQMAKRSSTRAPRARARLESQAFGPSCIQCRREPVAICDRLKFPKLAAD